MNNKNTETETAAGKPPALFAALPAFASIGVGRTLAYRLMNAGTVPAIKLGRKTMIRADDWQRFIANLPAYNQAKSAA